MPYTVTSPTLTEQQRIATSGARAVEGFSIDGEHFLAVAQVALDIAGTDPSMNGGDSDTDLLVLRRVEGRFAASSTLSAPGGEDAEFFTIDDRVFLAVASIRTGSGPYEFAIDSTIHAWDGSQFVPFQKVPTFAAKQWKHWTIDGRHFLGLAQGVQVPGREGENRDSVVFEWDGTTFVEHQVIPSRWAYNWHAFTVDGSFFVAHAEHLGASVLYRWDGDQLQPFQSLADSTGRAFATFTHDGDFYLVVATIGRPSRLLRWDGACFEEVQILDGLGARELAVVHLGGRTFVVRVNFILGSPADPQPVMDSQIYEFRDNALHQVATFPTTGGTDVTVLYGLGGVDEVELVVSNSLTAELRFATDTVVYSLSVRSE